MPAPARHLLLANLLLLLGQQIAAAHSSLESTLSFWIRPTGIDCQIYMSRGSSAVLLERPGEQITILPQNFSTFETRLAGNGQSLLSLAAGDGTALTANASTASITDEDDICYRLHYPLPTALPPTLDIHGNYLAKMDDGHVGSIYVLSATDDLLARGQIAAESPDLEVALPATVAPPMMSPAVKQAPAARLPLWAVFAAGGIVIAAIAARTIIRRTSKTTP